MTRPPTLTAAGTLTAADVGARTLTYRLLPYGEAGRTSLGLVTVTAGAVEVPDPSTVLLNLEHDRLAPVGRATAILEDAAGLTATFSIADTTRGSDLLAEAAAGLRTGVSVEIGDPVIRGGVLTAGRLTGAGAVVAPAFPSALLVAADTDPDPEVAPAAPDTPDPAAAPAAPAPPDPEDPVTDTAPLTAAAPPLAPTGRGNRPLTLTGAAELFAAARRGEIGAAALEAALADVPYTGNEAAIQPGWLGELWSGINYVRDIIDVISSGPLNAATLNGWKWATSPAGGDYAGDKAAIPSNAVAIDPVSQGIHRYAVGHDFDRIFVDLGDASVMESYFREVADDYAAWSNAHATADLITAAGTPLTGADSLDVLVRVAAKIKGGPTFIAVASDVAVDLMLREGNLPFLAGNLLLSGTGDIGGGGMFVGQELPVGTILAGRREAATHLEPAGSPIKVRAVDIARGGEDGAAFGYTATVVKAPQKFAVGTWDVTP